MNLELHHNEFIDYLKGEKNASHYTIDNYTSDFKQFIIFLSSNGIQSKFGAVTTPIVRRYIAYLKCDKNYSTCTIRRRIHSIIIHFYSFINFKHLKLLTFHNF